jgi:N-acetylneuraminic acid mutarotase
MLPAKLAGTRRPVVAGGMGTGGGVIFKQKTTKQCKKINKITNFLGNHR